MRRTAPLAGQVCRALARRGVIEKPRRLERWCDLGLGPNPGLPLDRQVDHFCELSKIAASGRGADLIARRLAARGYGCERLRLALVRTLDLDTPVPIPRLDLTSGPSGDESFAFVELTARSLASETSGLPPLMVKVLEAMKRNASQFERQAGMSGADLFHSFVVSALCHLFGDDLYNPTAIAASLNLSAIDIDPEAVDLMNSIPRLTPERIAAAYRLSPIDDIMAVAQLANTHAAMFLSHIGVRGHSQSEIEDFSATLAPAFLAAISLLKEQFEDIPVALPSERLTPPLPRASASV